MYSTQIASVCSFIGLRNVHCTYMYVNVYAVVFLFFKPETGRKSCAWWGLAQAWMWTFPKQLMWDMADFFFLLSLWVWQNKVPCCEHDLYTDTEPSVSPKLKSSLYIKNKFWRWLLLIFVTLVELLNLNLLYSWWHLVTDGSHLLGWTVWNKIVLQSQHNYFFFSFLGTLTQPHTKWQPLKPSHTFTIFLPPGFMLTCNFLVFFHIRWAHMLKTKSAIGQTYWLLFDWFYKNDNKT